MLQVSGRVGKYRDIFENVKNIEYVCVCVLCILGEVLSSFTLHCCGEVQSDRSCPTLEKMLKAQVISQQNTRTVDIKTQSRCVTLKKILKTPQKLYISKISDIFKQKYPIYIILSMIYIGDIYQANPGQWQLL